MMKQSVRRRVEEDLAAVMPEDAPGDLNQALMELGATVRFSHGAPRCGNVPLLSAAGQGLTGEWKNSR